MALVKPGTRCLQLRFLDQAISADIVKQHCFTMHIVSKVLDVELIVTRRFSTLKRSNNNESSPMFSMVCTLKQFCLPENYNFKHFCFLLVWTLVSLAYMEPVMAETKAHDELSGDIGLSFNSTFLSALGSKSHGFITSRTLAHNESTSSSHPVDSVHVLKRCGPKLQHGRVRFVEWEMSIPWSSAKSGTYCKNVMFENDFPTKFDVQIILTYVSCTSSPLSFFTQTRTCKI